MGFRTKRIRLCERAQNTGPENAYLDNIVDVIYCEFAFLCLVEPTHVGFDFQCQLSHFALTFVGAFGVQDLQKKCSLDKLEGLEIKQSKKDFD